MFHKKILFFSQWISEAFLFFIFPLVSILRFVVPLNEVRNHNSKKLTVVITEQWFVQTVSHVFMKWYLEQQHFKVYMFNFSPVDGGFDDGAYQLKKFIQDQKIKKCVLIGISMGAVTSYVYAQRFGGWKKIKKLICMGGPFKGTPWGASFFFLKNGQQILPESSFVKALQKEKLRYPKRTLCVTAKVDELVPRWSSVLTHARQKEVSVVGHNNLHVWSKEVWELVAKEAAFP